MVSLAIAVAFNQGSISIDPRLTDRIPFDSALIPMGQFIGMARATCGVSLTIDPSLEYLKVDAFVDDQPIGVTLSKLSEAFSLDWQRDGAGYKLVPNKVATDQEKAYLAEEDKQVDNVVDQEIAVYREIDRLIPKSKRPWTRHINRFESWIPKREAALDELERAKENKESAKTIRALQINYDALKKISEGTPNLQLARLFGLMRQDEIQEFRNGIPYIASNESKSRFQYSLGDIKPNDDMPISEDIRSLVVARVDPDSHRVGFKEMTFLDNRVAMSAEPPAHYPFDEISPLLANRPFALALKEWDQSTSFETSLKDTFNPSSDDISGGLSPWYGKRQRLGDHLRWFHQVTNVPIIAPADRIVHPFVRSYRPAKTQGEYLTKLLKACKGFGKKSGDFLLVRDGTYWRKLPGELPEHVLAQFEHPNRGKITFADYGRLSTTISHTQAMLLEDSLGFVLTFPRFRFAEAYPAFKFLHSLNNDQIRKATDYYEGLLFTDLSPEQKALFAFGVTEGVADRGFASDTMLTTLIQTGFRPDTLTMMKFHLRDVKVSAVYGSETVNEAGMPLELTPKLTFPSRPSKIFEFGYLSDQSKVSFLTEDLGL